MELTAPKAILFDWDNTLVNTWPVIHEALNKTFAETGRELWPMAMVKEKVARSMRDSFPLVFGENWQAAGEIYQRNFRAIHLERLEALKDAVAMLDYLVQQPVYLAVVSNKKGVNLRKECDHLGWGKYFSKLIGADDTPRDKPAPEPVLAGLEGSGIAPGPDVWFVGDSPIDMECAHATGCVPVWYGELPEALLAHPFTHRAADHAEFSVLLKRHFS
jgi:phosphoglycolate phosphatase